MAATEPVAEPRARGHSLGCGEPPARRAVAPTASNARRWGVATTAVVALGGFLAVLALLAMQLRNNPRSVGLVTVKPRVVIVRRVYQTTVHERIVGAAGPAAGGTTVQSSSASVSGPAIAAASAPLATHTS